MGKPTYIQIDHLDKSSKWIINSYADDRWKNEHNITVAIGKKKTRTLQFSYLCAASPTWLHIDSSEIGVHQ